MYSNHMINLTKSHIHRSFGRTQPDTHTHTHVQAWAHYKYYGVQ